MLSDKTITISNVNKYKTTIMQCTQTFVYYQFF